MNTHNISRLAELLEYKNNKERYSIHADDTGGVYLRFDKAKDFDLRYFMYRAILNHSQSIMKNMFEMVDEEITENYQQSKAELEEISKIVSEAK